MARPKQRGSRKPKGAPSVPKGLGMVPPAADSENIGASNNRCITKKDNAPRPLRERGLNFGKEVVDLTSSPLQEETKAHAEGVFQDADEEGADKADFLLCDPNTTLTTTTMAAAPANNENENGPTPTEKSPASSGCDRPQEKQEHPGAAIQRELDRQERASMNEPFMGNSEPTAFAAATSSANTGVAMGPRGRGRGSTLPAWMTQKQQQDFLAKNPKGTNLMKRSACEMEKESNTAIRSTKCSKLTDGDKKETVTTNNSDAEFRPSKSSKTTDDDRKETVTTNSNEPQTMTLELPPGFSPGLMRVLVREIASAAKVSKGTVQVSVHMKECTACQEWKTRTHYSKKKQWSDAVEKRACKVCIATLPPKEIQSILATTSGHLKDDNKQPQNKAMNDIGISGPANPDKSKDDSNKQPTTKADASIYGPANNEKSQEPKPTVISSMSAANASTGIYGPADMDCSKASSGKSVANASKGIYGPADMESNEKFSGKNVKSEPVKAAPKKKTTDAGFYGPGVSVAVETKNEEAGPKKLPAGWQSLGPPPQLPQGWNKFHDSNSSRYYYHNPRTGTTTWDRPTAWTGTDPLEWKQHLHPRFYETCFYNQLSNRWAWEPSSINAMPMYRYR